MRRGVLSLPQSVPGEVIAMGLHLGHNLVLHLRMQAVLELRVEARQESLVRLVGPGILACC